MKDHIAELVSRRESLAATAWKSAIAARPLAGARADRPKCQIGCNLIDQYCSPCARAAGSGRYNIDPLPEMEDIGSAATRVRCSPAS
jgi:hypothetical protein